MSWATERYSSKVWYSDESNSSPNSSGSDDDIITNTDNSTKQTDNETNDENPGFFQRVYKAAQKFLNSRPAGYDYEASRRELWHGRVIHDDGEGSGDIGW